MSHFTEYQVRRFRFIFTQHAEDAAIEIEVDEDDSSLTGSSLLQSTTHSSVPSTSSINLASPLKPVRSKLSVMEYLGSNKISSQSKKSSSTSVSSSSKGSSMNLIRSEKVKTNFRLTAKELQALLPRFGPPISLEQARDLIYKYDTSCTGTLDFDDFIECLADYEVTIEHKRESAKSIWQKFQKRLKDNSSTEFVHQSEENLLAQAGLDVNSQYIRALLNTVKTEEQFLAYLNLDDPELLWSRVDPLTKSMSESGLVTDPIFLCRKFTLRILEARNLDAWARAKKRDGSGLEFATLDPLVRISIAGITKETPAKVSTVEPEWNRELEFDLMIPPGEIHDVIYWAESQFFEFTIFDYNNNGVVPHTELLCYGTLPLTRVLLTTKKPLELAIRMDTPSGVGVTKNRIILEVHVIDHTNERGAYAKILDASKRPEKIWMSNYEEKFRNDIAKSFNIPINKSSRSPARLESSFSEDEEESNQRRKKKLDEEPQDLRLANNLLTYFHTVMEPLESLFTRRPFHAFCIDEYNTFRLLSTMIRPISPVHPLLKTATSISAFVSRIPFYAAQVAFSEYTHQVLSSLPTHIANELNHEPLPLSSSIIAWKGGYSHGESAFAQICHPATFLAKGRGTLMEHAILLCDLFLGIGLDAYVAIGMVQGRYHVWVITYESLPAAPLADSYSKPRNSIYEQTAFLDVPVVELTELVENTKGLDLSGRKSSLQAELDPRKFNWVNTLRDIQKENERVQAVHWDLLKGKSFSSTKDKGFRLERVFTIFNNQNMWFNVQKSETITRPMFAWNILNPKYWLPFFTSDAEKTFPPLKVPYDEPQIFYFPAFPRVASDKTLVTALIRSIQDYRRHFLFIATTPFDRRISQYLQDNLVTFEDRYSKWLGLQRREYTTEPSLRTGTVQGGLIGSIIPENKENKDTELDGGDLKEIGSIEVDMAVQLNQSVLELTPSGHYYWGNVYHFRDANLDYLIEQLIYTGILDCSASDVTYAIGAKVFNYPCGTCSVWIALGYLISMKHQ